MGNLREQELLAVKFYPTDHKSLMDIPEMLPVNDSQSLKSSKESSKLSEESSKSSEDSAGKAAEPGNSKSPELLEGTRSSTTAGHQLPTMETPNLKLSRSVSLSRINEIKKENPDEGSGLEKDDEEPLDHLTPSPKPIVGKDSPKVNVRKRREKFEPKNRARNVKDLAKDSRVFRRSKLPTASPKKEIKD